MKSLVMHIVLHFSNCLFFLIVRLLLAFVMVPLVQKELDVFRETVWNTHRIRAQKHTNLPVGIPNHIHNFPDQYGLEQCGRYMTL